MDEKRIARLRAHQQNIERYQRLLKTKLSDVETQFLERRLSEERFSIAMLDCMAPASQALIRDGCPLDL
jgi:hypothetical protein